MRLSMRNGGAGRTCACGLCVNSPRPCHARLTRRKGGGPSKMSKMREGDWTGFDCALVCFPGFPSSHQRYLIWGTGMRRRRGEEAARSLLISDSSTMGHPFSIGSCVTELPTVYPR